MPLFTLESPHAAPRFRSAGRDAAVRDELHQHSRRAGSGGHSAARGRSHGRPVRDRAAGPAPSTPSRWRRLSICSCYRRRRGRRPIEVIDCYKAWKASGAPREEFLRTAARIRGVYVPSLVRCKLSRGRHRRGHRARRRAPARRRWCCKAHGERPDRGRLSRKSSSCPSARWCTTASCWRSSAAAPAAAASVRRA